MKEEINEDIEIIEVPVTEEELEANTEEEMEKYLQDNAEELDDADLGEEDEL